MSLTELIVALREFPQAGLRNDMAPIWNRDIAGFGIKTRHYCKQVCPNAVRNRATGHGSTGHLGQPWNFCTNAGTYGFVQNYRVCHTTITEFWAEKVAGNKHSQTSPAWYVIKNDAPDVEQRLELEPTGPLRAASNSLKTTPE